MRTALKSATLGAMLALGTLLSGGTAAYADGGVIFLGGPLTDPFFGAMKLGSDTAAKELGVEYQYTAPPDFNDIVALYTRLGEAAVARNPSALVIGNFFPDAVEPVIKQAVEAKVPVIVYNSGRTTWRDLGAVTFIGEDPSFMGRRGGEAEVKAGVKNGICVDHVPANPVLEQRCKGYTDAIVAAGGKAKMITIPYEDTTNDQKLQQAIGGALLTDPTIDGVFTLGPTVAMNAIEAVKQTGRKIAIGTTDVSTSALEAIKAGDLLFALDQQPFLQGYYGVLVASQYVKYAVAPVSEVNTGPFIIDASNVEKVLSVSSTYPGLRGAN
jgi:simple sugar transport system substrate-binding protein